MAAVTAEQVTWTWPWTRDAEHWRLCTCWAPPEKFGGIEPFAVWQLTVGGVTEARSSPAETRARLAVKLETGSPAPRTARHRISPERAAELYQAAVRRRKARAS